MKRIVLLLTMSFFALNIYAQKEDSLWIRQHYIKKEQYIHMRDGIRLYTVMYIPTDAAEKHPILMVRTPYSSGPYGAGWMPAWKSYLKEYFKEGYCYVTQDVRGKYLSEGTFEDIRPYNPNKKSNKDVDEASDTYDTIDWLLKNIPNNNGKVGVFGTSYPGFYAAMAALSGHPALKAVSPQAPVTDWFMGDDFHHNGAFFVSDGFGFFVQGGFGAPRPKPSLRGGKGIPQPFNNAYDYYLKMGNVNALTPLAGDSIAFWKDMMAHPNLDSWWLARNDRQYTNFINPGTATLEVGGLFDAEDAFGTWHLYKAIDAKAKNKNRLVIGPWSHGQWGGGSKGNRLGRIKFDSNTGDYFKQNLEIPFFNYYLKDKGPDTLAKATVFFSGENKWHSFKQWPPVGEKPTPLYLGDDHKLSFSKSATGADSYVSDPANPVPYTAGIHKNRTSEYMVDDQRFVQNRKDVLTYETPVLDKDITLAGPLVADLFTSISTTDADFVVKLIDVFPSGNADTTMNNYQMLVRGDIMRGRYRKSFSKPEAFVPGKVAEVKFETNDIAHTFKKGHRIMVQVQSSWFPLVDRNPQQFVNIYKANNADFIKSTINVLHSKMYPSCIILPVVPSL
ncbi:MAG TPA: CocE/NonD family hydrolase [Mucilaginibacter sp.]|jgi:putative CocE/NonD family hydrolase|nr:CocE/NonD family hydrolase [Mucilaginibacter sp.]